MKQPIITNQITALYERLSRDDEVAGDSVSIQTHDVICKRKVIPPKTDGGSSAVQKSRRTWKNGVIFLPSLRTYYIMGGTENEVFFEERGGTYTPVGQVLIPNLILDDQPEGDIGIWGWRRKRYLKEHRKGMYNRMLMDGTITQHLIDINKEAQDMRERLVKQFQKADGVTEDLKRRDQMAWVGAMNSIYNRVDEIILHDLIYT